jgi:hypothetical protein
MIPYVRRTHVTLFHYQTLEYDCLPTALINTVTCLFTRKEIPAMVICHIYLCCMDAVGPNALSCIGGTSNYAARPVGSWLDQPGFRRFCLGPVAQREALRIWRLT